MTSAAPALSSESLHAPSKICTNCGHATVEVYCASCGEKQPDHHDRTFGHFAHELFHELAHVDSKVFRTLRDLIFRPGELTAAYFEGRKQRYIAPLRLFLTLFALQFLAYTAYKPVAVYNLETLLRMDATHQFEQKLHQAAAKRHVPYTELLERVNHRWQSNISLASMLNIAGLAVMLKLLYARRKRYIGEHLVFAAHLMAFTFIISLATWPVHLFTGVEKNLANRTLGFAAGAITLFYIFHGLRRFYGQGAVKRAFKSVFVLGAWFLTGMVLMGGSLLVAIFQVMGF